MIKKFRVSHARIQLDGLYQHLSNDDWQTALKHSWSVGVPNTRYKRTWRLSKWSNPEKHIWTGHIGFIKEDDLSTLHWDESVEGFIRGTTSSGIVIPFVINSDLHIVSYQLISGKVNMKTFSGNLQALLNKKGTYRWLISPLSLRQNFDDWQRTVYGISEMNIQMKISKPELDWTQQDKRSNGWIRRANCAADCQSRPRYFNKFRFRLIYTGDGSCKTRVRPGYTDRIR